jgi:replicative DNA helicase
MIDNSNRVLPKNIEIEKSIISGMMQSDLYFWNCVTAIIPDFFTVEILKSVFEKMVAEKKHDEILVENILNSANNSGKVGIEDLLCKTFSITGETEIKIITELYKKRQGIILCYAAANGYYSEDDISADETTSLLITGLNSVQCGSKKEIYSITDLLPDEIKRQEDVSKGSGAAYITTGFIDIDNAISIQKNDYIVIGARPSNCKSTFMGAICRDIVLRQRLPVLVFCLDSSKKREVSRSVFTNARINLSQFNQGKLPKRDYPKLSVSIGNFIDTPYFFDDTPGTTAQNIVSKSQRLKHELGNLGAVAIDFIQNVKSKQRNERDKINEISGILHELPRIIDCPVIALSQLSRYENEEVEPPKLRNLKESGNIEADADIAMLLWYSDFYKRYRSEKELIVFEKYDKTLLVDIAKYKDGDIGFEQLYFEASCGYLANLNERENNDWNDTKKVYGRE